MQKIATIVKTKKMSRSAMLDLATRTSLKNIRDIKQRFLVGLKSNVRTV